MLSSQETAASLLPTPCVHLRSVYRCQTVGKKCGWKESFGAYWILMKQTVSGIIFNLLCVLMVIRSQPFYALLTIQSRVLLHLAAEARL